MKKVFLFFSLIISFFVFAENSFAQQEETTEQQILRDPILEADSKHNLEVAWQYFKLKKAYKAVLDRCEEAIAANPTFSKMDEFLYLSGMSSYYLSINKGKQKVDLKEEKDKERFEPAKLKENAEAYLAQLVEQHPQSKYKSDAEKTLKKLKGDK